MFDQIKQLKNLREQAMQMKAMLDQEIVTATAAGGKVLLTMNGNQEILNIDINEELLNPNKKDECQKALKEAFEEANKKVQHLMASKLQSSGLNVPGLF